MTCHSSNYVAIAGFTIITLFFIHKNDRSFFKYTKTTAIYEISYKGRKKIQPPMTFVSVVHTKAKGYL